MANSYDSNSKPYGGPVSYATQLMVALVHLAVGEPLVSRTEEAVGLMDDQDVIPSTSAAPRQRTARPLTTPREPKTSRQR